MAEEKNNNGDIGLTAEQLQKEFKEHSVADFFKRNKQMLGLTGKIRTLTTIIHEYVTNSLDACEEHHVLPELTVKITEIGEEHYELSVQDNGPGLTKETVGKAFGQLLAGTKFHRRIQQRGQQGIGACMKGDTLVPLADGRILPIKEIVENNLVGEEAISLDLDSMKLIPGKIIKCWKPKNPLFVKIGTTKGRNISLTPENPILTIADSQPTWIRADEVQSGMHIAVPNRLPAFPKTKRMIDIFDSKTIQVENDALLAALKKKLLEKNRSLSQIAKKTGIGKDVLRNWFNRKMPNGKPRGRPTLEKLLILAEYAGMPKEELFSQINRVGRKGTYSNTPVFIDSETAWIAGLLAGDGHQSSIQDDKWGVNISFANKSPELIQKYKKLIEEKVGIKTQQYFHETKKYYTVQCSSKILSETLEFFGVTRGKKYNCFDLSNGLFALNDELIASYLCGLFDAEGSVSPDKYSINLTLYNKKAIEKVFYALLRLGIHASINKAGNENRISITQKQNIYEFYKKVGFSETRKKKLLLEILSHNNEHSQTDRIPNIARLTTEYVRQSGPLTALPSASYTALHKNRITKNALQQVLQTVGIHERTGQFLHALAFSDVAWLEVTKTEFEKNEEEFVFDLEIEQYHNFIAGGIICHNSGATMLALGTTGKPIQVITGNGKNAFMCELTIDSKTNQPKIIKMEDIDKPFKGTAVKARFKEIKYQRSEQGPFEYLRRTAIANPHAKVTLFEPDGTKTVFDRTSSELPPRPIEVPPHPRGMTIDELLEMSHVTKARKVSAFLKTDFDRMGEKAIEEIEKKIHFDLEKDPKKLVWEEAEEIVKAFKAIQFIAPRTDGLRPIGEERIQKSVKEIVEPEFLSVVERKPSVYQGGFAFQVETAVGFGGNAGRNQGKDEQGMETKKMEVMRFANRVPLLFDSGGCALTKAVQTVDWRRYGIKDLDNAPLTVFIHILSVHIPYTGAGKQAVADEEEVMEELRLALMDTGRKIYRYVAMKKREEEKQQKRKLFMKYAAEVAYGLQELTKEKKDVIEKKLLQIVLQRLKIEEEQMAKEEVPEELDEKELEKEAKKEKEKKGKKKKSRLGGEEADE